MDEKWVTSEEQQRVFVFHWWITLGTARVANHFPMLYSGRKSVPCPARPMGMSEFNTSSFAVGGLKLESIVSCRGCPLFLIFPLGGLKSKSIANMAAVMPKNAGYDDLGFRIDWCINKRGLVEQIFHRIRGKMLSEICTKWVFSGSS